MGVITYIFLCIYISHITVGQTFQYSRGWTNGKRGIILIPLKKQNLIKQNSLIPCNLKAQTLYPETESKQIRTKFDDHELTIDSDGIQRSIKEDDAY
uniref:Pro-corazonin n=1 Tax=Culicoides sonorensis TaxID=179676 RepID=A0A336L4M9_CULSO